MVGSLKDVDAGVGADPCRQPAGRCQSPVGARDFASPRLATQLGHEHLCPRDLESVMSHYPHVPLAHVCDKLLRCHPGRSPRMRPGPDYMNVSGCNT